MSDFTLFFFYFLEKLQPLPEKKLPPLFQNPSLKIEVLSRPPFLFENLVGGSTPSAEREGAHYGIYI